MRNNPDRSIGKAGMEVDSGEDAYVGGEKEKEKEEKAMVG